MDLSAEKQLELIRANTVEIIPEEELLEKLRSGRPLRVRLSRPFLRTVRPSG